MTKHRLAMISPDADSDYCYLDMTDEEALAQFREHEDFAMYDARGYVPVVVSMEFDNSFLLWRNKGNDMARWGRERGIPEEFVRLFGNPDKAGR
jgi:hypothetical protein